MPKIYAQRKNVADVSPEEICCEEMREFFEADTRKHTYLVDTKLVRRRIFECAGCKRRTSEESGLEVIGPPEVAGGVLRTEFFDLDEGAAPET